MPLYCLKKKKYMWYFWTNFRVCTSLAKTCYFHIYAGERILLYNTRSVMLWFYSNCLIPICLQDSAPLRLYFSCLTVTQLVSYSKYYCYYYIIIFFESRSNACKSFVKWDFLGSDQGVWERHFYCCCLVVLLSSTLLFLHAQTFLHVIFFWF